MFKEIISEIKNIKSSKEELKKFGVVFTIVLIFFAFLLWRKHDTRYTFFGLGALLVLTLRVFEPMYLKPLQKIVMSFGIMVTTVLTQLTLLLVFYLVITPIGYLSKMQGKKFLDLSFKKSAGSYWQRLKNQELSAADFENQY